MDTYFLKFLQRIEFLSPPDLQTPHGTFPVSSFSLPPWYLQCMVFLFCKLTLKPSVTYPGIFWGDRFQQGDVMLPYWSRAKPWWGPGSKTPRSSKHLVLWNQLLLIKMCPPQPVMKLIQRTFFQKSCQKSSLK